MKGSNGYHTESFKLWIYCLLELLLFFPLWVLFQVYVISPRIDSSWMYFLPLLTLVGIYLRIFCNVRWKQLIASCVLGLGLGVMSGGSTIPLISLAVAGSICSYHGMTAVSRQNLFRVYWLGIPLYFIAAIVFHRIPRLHDSSSLITSLGSVCLVLSLFVSNRQHLKHSSFSEGPSPLPQGLRRHNFVFVILFVAVAVLLAAGLGKALGNGLLSVLRYIFNGLNRLFSGKEPSPLQEEAPPPLVQEMPMGETHEPGLLALIFDYFFYIAGAAILGVVLFFTLRWLYRNTSGIWHKLIGSLLSILKKEQSPHRNHGYVDEEKSIFTFEKTLQDIKDFWRSKLNLGTRRDLWENMNGNKEQVRWLYRQWLWSKRKSGYEAKNYLTPRETGTDVMKWSDSQSKHRKGDIDKSKGKTKTDTLLDLYDEARYGGKEPSAKEITELKERMKL